MKTLWGKKEHSGKRHIALLLAVLVLMSTIPVFTYAEDIVGGEPGSGASSSGEAAPAEESKPEAEEPTESGPSGGESPSEERRRDRDDKGSTDEYSLTVTQEELFTEDGLAVEITAVSTFPFTRNLHIEAKDGGKAEGATEGDEKVTGDPEASLSEASSSEMSSEASSDTSSETSPAESSVPEEPASSEEAGSDVSSVPEEPVSSEESKPEENSKPDEAAPSSKPEEEKAPNSVSEFVEAAASARINLVRVLSADITADELTGSSKPADDPAANTSNEEEKTPAPAESSSASAVSSGEDASSDVSSAAASDASQDNSTDSSSEPSSSDASSSDASSSDASSSDVSSSQVSSTDETMSEGKVTVNGEGEPFRFQRKFTVTKNGTYVVRIYDDEGPLEERAFYTEVEVTSLGELTAEIVPGSYGQYEVEMASTYPETDRFVVEYIPAAQAMYRSRSAQPAEGEPVEVPVEDVTVKTTGNSEEDKDEENAPSEVTEASAAVPMSADGVYTVKAFRGENLLTTMSLMAGEIELHSLAAVYWNPDPETKSNADGTFSVPGGDDNNPGTAYAPVRSFEQALELVAPSGTIYCMNSAVESADYLKRNSEMAPENILFRGVFDGYASSPVRVERHANHPSGAIFTLGEGVTMTLSEIEIAGENAQTDELIRLAGGTLKIGTGLRLPAGQIFFDGPSTAKAVELLAIPEDTLVLSFTPGESSFKASFDAVRAAEGISMEDVMAKLALADALQTAEPKWSLEVRADETNVVQARPDVFYDEFIYLSGKGDDANTGATAADPVRTFARAKELLTNELNGSGSIRFCGTVPVEGDEVWSGATIYRDGNNGNPLVQVSGSLTLDGITMDGGSPSSTGNISVSGGSLTVTGGSALSGTKTGGGVSFEDPMIYISKGSAVLGGNSTISGTDIGVEIARDGTFTLESGTISDVLRGVEVGEDCRFEMKGGSISAARTGVGTLGEFVLSGGSVSASNSDGFAVWVNHSEHETKAAFLLDGSAATVSGNIRLETPEEKITLTGAPGTGKTFAVELGDSHHPGNVIVAPSGALTSAEDYAAAFTLSGTVYELAGYQNNLVLMGGGVYLDGTTASSGTGLSPASPVRTFAEAMNVLRAHSEIPAKVILCGPVTVSSTETWFSPRSEVVEVTRWDGADRSFDRFVTVKNAGTNLSLENIVLDGRFGEANTSVNTIVSVEEHGVLTLSDGAVIRGSAGSGVKVSGDGLVLITAGEISGNKGRGIDSTGEKCVIMIQRSAKITGNGKNGVYLDGGFMDMSGGEISGNYTALEETEKYRTHRGGGVWIEDGEFTMSGGVISGNLCDIRTYGGEALGGGVYFAGSKMTVSGDARISGNTATKGGGVYLNGGSISIEENASISGNHVNEAFALEGDRHYNGAFGGGVYVEAGGLAIKGSASVADNKAEAEKGRQIPTGGGVYLAPGAATLRIEGDAAISGNTAERGAGVAHEGAQFNLGGTGVTIGDEIFIDMNQGTEKAPISLTGALGAGKVFKIRVPDTYIGKTVVKGGTGYDAATYLSQGMFTQSGTGGGLTLEGKSPDIVGQGGLYVYLDGVNGNDGNNGTSPNDAVKTFARAQALLQSRPAGTNILISGTVEVRGTETWSLPEMTNDSGTWQPEIRTMADGVYNFAPIFVNLSGGKLTLENIIINGNGVSMVTSSTASAPSRYGAGLIQVSGGAALVLNSGTVIENGAGPGVVPARGTCTINEGVIIRDNAGPGLHTTANDMTITMNGGSVTGNRTGGVMIEGSDHKFIMNGGTISGNTHGEISTEPTEVKGHGGGVCISATNSSFEMKGGEISGNEAAKNGGGVYLSSGVDCVITKGRITENRAGGSGGGLYGNKVELDGGAEISRNTAGASGGGVYAGNVIMRGGAISDNTASAYGGGINISGGIESTLSGGTVSGNTAAGGGGIYLAGAYITLDGVSITGNRAIGTSLPARMGGGAIATYFGCRINIHSGKISDNESAVNGGAIMMGVSGFNLTIEGGEISGNKAAGDGGAIYLHNCSDFTMSGGSISGNTAGGSGGGITGNPDDKIPYTYNGGSITGNTAAENGGGIYLESEAEFNGVTVSDNTARAGGGVWVADTGSLTINAGSITGNRTTSAGVTGGAGVCLDGGTVTAAGGQISGNALGNSTQKGAGVYVADGDFVLRGGRAVIDDPIYLDTTASPVWVSAAITQNRKYRLTMNMGNGATQYKFGSAVVSPLDGSAVSDASAYLRYFQSNAEGVALDKSSPNIVLSKIVFLDGENGGTSDWYDGSTPTKAFKTFELAKAALAGEPGAIYVTGTVTVDESTAWSLGNGQYLRRYNGFEVAGQKSYDAFAGDLVRVANGGSLTLTNIPIEGRRSAEDSYTASGTLVHVSNGGTLTMNAGAALRNNKTSGDGGAVIVEEGGTFLFSGGEISNSQATRGDAVYQGGTMKVDKDASAKGSVYLAAGKTVDAVATLTGALTVDMADPYMGRDVVVYPGELAGNVLTDQLAKFTLAEAVAAQYRLVHNGIPGMSSVFKLGEKGFVYVDGSLTADAGDGSTPDTAFATLRAAYSRLQREGGTIYIVNPVTITESIKITADSYSDKTGSEITLTGGPVAVKRYSKPTKTLTGYGKASNKEELFIVASGGSLQLTGTTIDGHSEAVTQGREALIAPAVSAQKPLVTVQSGGEFLMNEAALRNNNNVYTSNLGGAINNNGTLMVTGGTIANTKAAKGAAIYQNGTFFASGSPSITGEVYLAGSGSNAKVIEPERQFAPVDALLINMDGTGEGRKVVDYPEDISADLDAIIPYYTLADEVPERYTLGQSTTDKSVLELQIKGEIYIDGVSGSDEADGKTPKTAVKTLAEAYKKLAAQKGGTLYVVGEITIGKDQNITLSGQELFGAGYMDAGGPVTIKRYSQPTAHANLDGYEVGGNTGSLFVVEGGGSLTLENITADGHLYETYGSAHIAAPAAGGDAIVTVNEGKLILNEGAVLQNNAGSEKGGGGIHVSAKGAANMGPGSLVTGCTAGKNGGGGVYVALNGSLTMTDAEISNCSAVLGGGALVAGDSSISGGVFSGNTADNFGGGLFYPGGRHTVSDTTFSNNTAKVFGGGMYLQGDVHVDGDTQSGAKVALNRCVFTGNTANINGGGIGTMTGFSMTGGTFSDNKAGSGSGIWMSGTEGDLTLNSSSALRFDADQTVYLDNVRTIRVTGPLPESVRIPVDMARYNGYGPGRDVVVYMDGVVEDVAAEAVKFPLADDIEYALVKSPTEANTLELGSAFQFVGPEQDFLKQAGVQATIMAEVSSPQVESCELYCGETKVEAQFKGVVNSPTEGKSYVSVTFTPEWDAGGSYHLQATDSNGTTVKSKNFTISLWRVAYSDNGTAMETSTLGAGETGPNDTATLEVKAFQPLVTDYDPADQTNLQIDDYALTGDDASFAPQLVEKDAVVSSRTVWGSDDAMKKFAITRTTDGVETPVGTTRAFSVNATVPYSLYNANAISEEKDGSMTMRVTLRRGEVEYAADTAEIKLHTNPARIDATVPLWVCMYGYGGDGKVVTPEEESYAIQNNSSFPVAVTEMSVHPADSWNLVPAPEGGFAPNGSYDVSLNTLVEGEAALRLDTHWISSGVNGADWSMSAGDASTGPLFQPIGAGTARSIPVECYIPAGGVAGEGETLLATVTYTVGVSGSAANGG